jgi:mono/diheme cytochrome c family protein
MRSRTITSVFFLGATLLVGASRAAPSTALIGVKNAKIEKGDAGAGKLVFAQNCVICHGASGHGDGPAAAGLKPKPADFSDHERMSKVTDDIRVKAVSEGGSAVGVSPIMPAFKDALTEKQIRDVLAFVKQEFTH